MERYFNVNREGCSISCKLYADDKNAVEKVILFGHGFGGNKDNGAAEKLAKRVLSKNRGAALVIFDWPCHGDDVRKTLRLGDCEEYLRIMIEWIGETYKGAELYGCATSFGGYLFLKYVSEDGDPFRKICLRCPAVNMYEVITKNIMTEDDRIKLEKGKPVLMGFDRKIRIDKPFTDSLREADIRSRDFLDHAEDILIIHGSADEVVPFDAVAEFADNNLIEFISVDGADHRFTDPAKMERVLKSFTEFFGMR